MPGESHPKVTRRQSEFGSLLNIAAGILITFALTADGAPPRLFVVAAVLAAAALVPSATVGRIFSLALLALSLFLAYNGTNARKSALVLLRPRFACLARAPIFAPPRDRTLSSLPLAFFTFLPSGRGDRASVHLVFCISASRVVKPDGHRRPPIQCARKTEPHYGSA